MYTFLEITTMSSFDDVIAMVQALQAKVESQERTILELRENINGKNVQIQNQGDVLYQLVGGLFHQDKQAGSIDDFVALLLPRFRTSYQGQKKDDEEYYRGWPTTRQGDALEQRMDDLSNSLSRRLCLMDQEMGTLKYDIKNLKDQMTNVSYALQELGASLFNQETQKQSWRELRDIFVHDGGYDDLEEPLVNTSKWRHPTTRQGDELEKRVDELEAKLVQMGDLFRF